MEPKAGKKRLNSPASFFPDMTTAQIEHENTQLINDLYRLLKKYLGLRHLIRVLKVSRVSGAPGGDILTVLLILIRICIFSCVRLCAREQEEYGSSKMYPIFPRYTMLKDMIKGIMHDPDYMEVCHETLANAN